ncbi:MAG: hypothetical protein HGB11_04935, partial [Chlorobiales bacterium]|nr:hypothetical protein [Chlorobiales bacterium]
YRTTDYTIAGNNEKLPINFSLLKTIPLGSQKTQGLSDTVYQDVAVDLDQPYFYRLSAYSRSGGESVTSDENPNYELRSLSDGLEVKSGGQTATVLPFPYQDSTLTFTWTPRGSATGGKYIVKIYEYDGNTGEEIIVAWAQITGGYTSDQPISLNIDFSNIGAISPDIANDGRILNHIKSGDQTYGRQYFWRIYYVEGQSTDLMTLQGSIAEGTFNLGD